MKIVSLLVLFIPSALFTQTPLTGTIRISKPPVTEDTINGKIVFPEKALGVKCRNAFRISDRFGLTKERVERVFYDVKGLTTEILHRDDGYKTLLKYDSKDRIASRWFVNAGDGLPIWMEELSYPSSGQVLTVRTAPNKDHPDSLLDTLFRRSELFDGAGNILEQKEFRGRSVERTLFIYDSLMRISKEFNFTPGIADSILYTREHFYDSLGLHEIRTDRPYYKSGKFFLRKSTEKYYYDPFGKLLKEERTSYKGDPARIEYAYDENGKVRDVRSFITTGKGLEYEHLIYEYILY